VKNPFIRNKKDSSVKDSLSELFQHSGEAQAFFPEFMERLLFFLKSFSLDAKELNTEEFRNTIELLARRVKTGKSVKEVESLFEKKKKMMAFFIKKQNLYLVEKEAEYKDMVDLLTRAMAKISAENNDFSEKMLEQSSKIENVSSLSDIKQIKDTLKSAIKEIRERVREKQALDGEQMTHLAQKVKALSAELKKAEKGSMRDALTGVYNMNGFKQYILKTLENNTHKQTPLILAALDIDELDKIVKIYDHKIGDRVLLAIADKCREFLKSGDFAARYEKGLFVMVLSGEKLRKVAKRAKQFCRTIEKCKYALDDMRSEHVFSFTISIGLTPFIIGDTAETVIRRALAALNSARNAGGNRIISRKS
jgi:diguanylate cyclase